MVHNPATLRLGEPVVNSDISCDQILRQLTEAIAKVAHEMHEGNLSLADVALAEVERLRRLKQQQAWRY